MLSIVNISPKSLRKNSWNTNKVSVENEEKLDKSIKEYGVFKPILCRTVNEELEIIGGEHRVDAAIRLGLAEVPVVNLGNISDDKAKKIGLLDNGRYGSDDFAELQNLINSLENPEEIMKTLPYNFEDFEGLFQTEDINLDEIPSFDDADEEEVEILDKTTIKLPETHATIKFKIPLEFIQDFDKKIKDREEELGLEYDDKLKNMGNAILSYVLGEDYVK